MAGFGYNFESRQLANQPHWNEFFAPSVRRDVFNIFSKFYKKPCYFGYEGISADNQEDYRGYYEWSLANSFYDDEANQLLTMVGEKIMTMFYPEFVSKQKIFSIIINGIEYKPDNQEINGWQSWGNGKIFKDQFDKVVFYPEGPIDYKTTMPIDMSDLGINLSVQESLSNLMVNRTPYYELEMPSNYKINRCIWPEYSTGSDDPEDYAASEAANSFRAIPKGQYQIDGEDELSCRLYWPMWWSVSRTSTYGHEFDIVADELIATERDLVPHKMEIGSKIWYMTRWNGTQNTRYGSFLQIGQFELDPRYVEYKDLKPIQVIADGYVFYELYLTDDDKGTQWLTLGYPYGDERGYWVIEGAPNVTMLEKNVENRFTIVNGTEINEEYDFPQRINIQSLSPTYVYPYLRMEKDIGNIRKHEYVFDIPTWL